MSAERSMGSKVASGAAWMMAKNWSIRLLGMVSTLILARLLTPEDYGLVALAASVIAVLDVASDFSFSLALVRFQDADRREYDTAWTLNVVRGFVLAVVLSALSPLAAMVFGDKRVVPVMIALGASFIFNGVSNVGVVDFMKELTFGKEFYLRVLPKIVAVVVSISWALVYRNYWALVAGTLSNQLTVMIMSYVMSPYRPGFALTGWRRLFSFSGWLMASHILQAVTSRLENFVLGAFLTPRIVGLYNVGMELSGMTTTELVSPIRTALFPGLSASTSDPAAMRRLYLGGIEVMASIGLPCGIGFALVAKDLVPLLLGEHWVDAVPVIQTLAPLLAVLNLAGPSTTILLAMGRTDTLFRLNVVQFVVRVVLGIALIKWLGLDGALISRVSAGTVWLLQLLLAAAMIAGTPLMEPLRRTWRSIFAALGMAACLVLLGDWLAMHWPDLAVGWRLAAKVSCGVVTYLLIHLLLWQLASRPDGVESLVLKTLQAARR